MTRNKSVLIFPDAHFPYQHPDIIGFLASVKAKFKPDRVICLGDEVDHHALSFHDSSPELDSAGPELDKAIKLMQPLYKLFPRVDVLESNHGSLAFRKAKAAGIPKHLLIPYRAQVKAPKDWHWHFELMIRLPDESHVYFTHGKTSNHLALARAQGCHAVQGHFHEKFGLNYVASHVGTLWQAHVGCLIDDSSLAYAYNKTNLHRPILGCMVIIDSIPQMLPMRLKENGRWTGRL